MAAALEQITTREVTISALPPSPPPGKNPLVNLFASTMEGIQPPPQKTGLSCKAKILIIFFPLGILWLIQALVAKILFKLLLGEQFIRSTFLPALKIKENAETLKKFATPTERERWKATLNPLEASSIDTAEQLDDLRKAKVDFCANPENRTTPLKIKTSDGVILEGMIMWSKECWEGKKSIENSNWAVLYNGNNMTHLQHFEKDQDQDGKPTDKFRYERMREQYQEHPGDATNPDLGFNLISFDYRGVVDSGMKDGVQQFPTSAADIILDAHAPIQMLLQAGVPPGRIFIEGVSIGGGFGAKAAEIHTAVNVANIHSFRTISHVAESVSMYLIKTKCWDCHCVAKVISYLFSCFANWLLYHSGWDLDTESGWSTNKGFKRIDTAKKDELMHGMAPLEVGRIGKTVLYHGIEIEKIDITPEGKASITYVHSYDAGHAHVFNALMERRLFLGKLVTLINKQQLAAAPPAIPLVPAN